MVILNRSKLSKTSPMKQKDTHSIPDIEGLIHEKLHIIQNGATMKEKKKARTEVIRLERMLRDVSNKHINGKKYPERIKGLPDDKPMNKTELLKLIDSVESKPRCDWPNTEESTFWGNPELDESGVSVGKDRFEFVEKGWAEPKFKNRFV